MPRRQPSKTTPRRTPRLCLEQRLFQRQLQCSPQQAVQHFKLTAPSSATVH